MDYVWETRHEKTIEHFSPDEAMAVCREAKPGDKPIVLADFSDNAGGGSYGDSPALHHAMIEAGRETEDRKSVAEGKGGEGRVGRGGRGTRRKKEIKEGD